MEQRTCPACGAQFTPTLSTQRACPPTAEDRARTKGQPRSKCARKLYNAAQRGVPVVVGKVGQSFDCAQCGTPCEPGVNVAPHATRFCGPTCKATWHQKDDAGWYRQQCRARRRADAVRRLKRASKGQKGGQWIEDHASTAQHASSAA